METTIDGIDNMIIRVIKSTNSEGSWVQIAFQCNNHNKTYTHPSIDPLVPRLCYTVNLFFGNQDLLKIFRTMEGEYGKK